jgi:hypothetical protein
LRPIAGAASSSGSGLGERISEAWQDSLDFLAGILGGVVTAVVFGWWLPLVAIPAAHPGRPARPQVAARQAGCR